MMSLHELVDRYKELAGSFGQPVALASFGLDRSETERLFSAYDEDYHISRFFQFTRQAASGKKRGTRTGRGGKSAAGGGAAAVYSINGIPATHVSLDAEIASIL
jgi:hypothetical protein